MLTRERVEVLIAGHKERLFECISAGVADYYLKYPASLRQAHTARTRASVRHDHIVDRVRATFTGSPQVEMIELRGLFLLLIDGMVAIRFHKITEDGHCHSNATAQTLLFHNQAPMPQQEEFQGIPAHATHLIGGYQLNSLGTAISEISLSCPKNGRIVWQMPLAAAVAPVQDLAARRAEEQSEKKPKQVRGRKASERSRAKDGDDGAR